MMIRQSTRVVEDIGRGVSMQRDCTHCMHKVHKSYKYTVQRRDGWLLLELLWLLLLKVIHA
jgi:hypothetical protein